MGGCWLGGVMADGGGLIKKKLIHHGKFLCHRVL